MAFSLHSEALAEYKEAVLYYKRLGRGLAKRFTDSVEEAIVRIKLFPRAHAADQRRVRSCLLRRFPYAVKYVVEQDSSPGGAEHIVVYAIRHSRREADDWLHRLPPLSGNN